jgi:hypothetical protein
VPTGSQGEGQIVGPRDLPPFPADRELDLVNRARCVLVEECQLKLWLRVLQAGESHAQKADGMGFDMRAL